MLARPLVVVLCGLLSVVVGGGVVVVVDIGAAIGGGVLLYGHRCHLGMLNVTDVFLL